MSPTTNLLDCCVRSIQGLDHEQIDDAARILSRVRRERGRLFLAGSGGGAAHASHACCDFRKLCGIEAYCVSDNAAELTARVNDDGWESSYANWLRVPRLDRNDALLIVSVGGGSTHPPVSTNLVTAMEFARSLGAATLAVVGRDGGHAGRVADVAVLIPCDRPEFVTPVTEAVQSVVLHALAVHPLLAILKAKWEGLV
jgi:D-sedoheptulose 7-phosphate isomerase